MTTDDLTPEAVYSESSAASARAQFINRTYTHLLGAILAFAAIEFWIFQTPLAEAITQFAFNTSWLAILGAFVVVSWIASGVAHRVSSKPQQYAALGVFVVAEALIFVPMFYIAAAMGPDIIEKAVWVTLGAFVALTAVAMLSGRDFTFLRSFLMWGGMIALGTIVMGAVAGFNLGTYFSMAMIGLAGAAILYDTSKVLRDYPDEKYIAAALELFASIALMLWYVLRLFMRR